jgi:hypothetical protein
MNAMRRSKLYLIGVACLAGSLATQAADKPAAMAMPSDAELVKSALSAGPPGVAKNATVVAMTADGKVRTLRKGSGDFTCMADNPETPGPDPMCWDKNADGWINALLAHATPPPGKLGFIYMLAGGTDASNTDPFATKPTADNHWIKTGPHVMIVGADASFYDQYPKKPDPDTSAPYVMYYGTPYQHLMAPVK